MLLGIRNAILTDNTIRRVQTSASTSSRVKVFRLHRCLNTLDLVRPSTTAAVYVEQAVLCLLILHPGAYYLGSAAEKRVISAPLAQYTDARVSVRSMS